MRGADVWISPFYTKGSAYLQREEHAPQIFNPKISCLECNIWDFIWKYKEKKKREREVALVTAFSSNQTTEGKGKEGILAPCKVKEESLAQLLTVNLPPLMTLMMATMKLTWARQWILTNFSAADRSILGCQPGRRERTRCWGERLSNKTIHILCCLAAKSCLTLCNPVDSSLPGSSVYGISQVRILEWVAISSSRGSSWPRYRTCVSCTGRQFLQHWVTREALMCR